MRKIKTIIGLCGGSGSGKTSLVQKISEEFDEGDITVLSMDDYYKSIDEQQKDENGEVNFDLPSAINVDEVCSDVDKLIRGENVSLLEYTFNNPLVEPKSKELQPNKILIVEGIFLLYYPELVNKMDFTVYIDVDPQVQLSRRLERDLEFRGYSEEQIRYQWDNHVIPCFKQFIEPFIDNADIIINNNQKDTFNVEPVISRIQLFEI